MLTGIRKQNQLKPVTVDVVQQVFSWICSLITDSGFIKKNKSLHIIKCINAADPSRLLALFPPVWPQTNKLMFYVQEMFFLQCGADTETVLIFPQD